MLCIISFLSGLLIYIFFYVHIIEFKTHKTGVSVTPINSSLTNTIFHFQIKMYKESLNDSSYTYARKNPFQNSTNDVKVVATKIILKKSLWIVLEVKLFK